MSRSLHQSRGRKVSSCACGRCSGFKAQPRALTVEGDLAANGIADPLEPLRLDGFGDGSGHTECRTCRSCVECADCECARAA